MLNHTYLCCTKTTLYCGVLFSKKNPTHSSTGILLRERYVHRLVYADCVHSRYAKLVIAILYSAQATNSVYSMLSSYAIHCDETDFYNLIRAVCELSRNGLTSKHKKKKMISKHS